MYLWITHLLPFLLPARRDEKGLSQSTENALLVAGAVTIAGIVVAAVLAIVEGRLTGLK